MDFRKNIFEKSTEKFYNFKLHIMKLLGLKPIYL